MQISSFDTLSKPEWQKQHDQSILFVKKYSGKRITTEGFRHFVELTYTDLLRSDVSFLIATVRGDRGPALAGVSFISGHGEDACLIVVHPFYRGRHVGTSLMSSQLTKLGEISCNVALDNIQSLQMCFNAGLTAGSLHIGPTGKPCLKLHGEIRNNYTPTTSILEEGESICHVPS
ncbi:hypothetical protein [Paenibacillus glacialis]|uniref:N-acetyltransferase domain-containing protein n=1 Tax=Paenibacillus glacialis TaxID=494026 RepID=A0A168LDJ6_9BACL|nr:hypothetical protein [Paenibacillus glacialis]OAB43239.1 hypothetical protein PGLA_09605 [Paenibacillus glacialis]